jgi:aspartate racemase
MKTVGIIGGLGPQTTAKFYMQLVSLCAKKNKTQRPNILIQNVPVSLALEERFINRAEGKREFRSLLINAAKTLGKSGADFLVLPCNTAHVFIDDIRNCVNIPVLSIIDETAKVLSKKGSIGLLSTPATIKNKLFDKKLRVLKPKKFDQKEMGTIINRILNDKHTITDKLRVLEIIDSIPAKRILLACTDLQLLITEKEIGGKQIFDTMEILAQATVREILSRN